MTKKKEEVKNEAMETVSDEMETVFIYCGPTSNFISRYTSYRNGLPLHLKEHLEKLPVLEKLFIEPKNFAEFEKNVAEKGSFENACFQVVKEYFTKVVS